MSPFAQVVLAGIGTYLFRVCFIAWADRFERIPPRVETMLSMIPPAVLAAITANSLFFHDGAVQGLDEWHIAVAVTAFVAWRTKSVAWCLVVGMPLVWGLAALG
ncbi:MAG: AzlD domain-containing protein [Acidimicrobiales bacterium]